jgi:CRISPR-associated protein Cas2
VGTLNRRIRDRLWRTICSRLGTGQALMIERADNEQGWMIRSTGDERYRPADFEGLMLLARRSR